MIKRFIEYIYLYRKATFIIGVVLLLLCMLLAYFSPHTFQARMRSVCLVESKEMYVVTFKDGKELQLSVSQHRFSDVDGDMPTASAFTCSGFFVSNDGHLVTTTDAVGNAQLSLPADTVENIVEKEKSRVEEQQKAIDQDVRELDYYSKTHSVIDDGYNEIMEYREKVHARKRYIDSLLTILVNAEKVGIKNCRLKTDFTISFANVQQERGDTAIVYRMKASLLANEGNLLLLRTQDGEMPASAKIVSPYYLPLISTGKCVTGFWDDSCLPDAMSLKTMPKGISPYINGAICSNSLAQTCGVYHNGDVIGMYRVCALVNKFKSLPLWIISDAYYGLKRFVCGVELKEASTIVDKKRKYGANVKGLFSVSNLYGSKRVEVGLYSGRLIKGQPDGFGVVKYESDGGMRYAGYWENGKRAGEGVLVDSAGQTIKGVWVADTISTGTIINKTGVYVGEISADMLPEGVGSYSSLETHLYYYGNWHKGKRDGYGYEIGGKKIVRSGIWRKNRFRGEQMVYTKDRVYGIDISRYQHEIGRRKYGIAWAMLRIKSLGTSSKKKILGRVDYPVSFVYIKASQGVRVWNKYYPSDIRSARRCGYKVGAYHFLSTRTPARAQALHFLAIAKPRLGDLPPMLDVEPTDKQIVKMGGKAVLFRQILAWMHVVERVTGTKPVLYVGQEFVNKYLPHAPAELSNYQVWIARYGQFKPYVHLLYWQLSADGRIRGIRGNVDVNVFNGTKLSFKEYVRQNCVKR